MSTTHIRIGTRSSALARWQANHVADLLGQQGASTELVLVSTAGDETSAAIVASGDVGVFTKELQRALLQQKIDLAVHSLKDLPTAANDELTLAAVPARGSVHDALVTRRASSLNALPAGSRVGTGSPRRQAHVRWLRSDLEVSGIRGNVDTRLGKLDAGECDALILAAAGLERLGLSDRITQRLQPAQMMPAPGQGALGIECRATDDRICSAVQGLHHLETYAAVTAEREVLRVLEAGCHSAVGAWCRSVTETQMQLEVVVLSHDGKAKKEISLQGPISQPSVLGQRAAAELIQQGALEIIRDTPGTIGTG